MAQNFIPKTSTILCFIKKEFLKYISSKESNGSLKSFKSIKVQSYIFSYSFIHSLMSKIDKNVPLIICDFHTKDTFKRETLSFFEEEILRFHIWNFESGRSLQRKVHFFQLPWDN